MRILQFIVDCFVSIFTQFDDPDEIRITDEDIDYYKNYYLKGKIHKNYITKI